MAKDRERPRPPRTWTKLVLLALAASLAIWLAGCGGDAPADDAGPLRLGLMVNLSAGAPARAVERQRAFELAVQHVNAAGGVFGQPVQFVVGDSTLDPEKAVAVARRLVEEEGVHAIVGPTSSANALAVAERVTGPVEYTHRQPLGHVARSGARQRRRLLLPHHPVGWRSGAGAGAGGPRTGF